MLIFKQSFFMLYLLFSLIMLLAVFAGFGGAAQKFSGKSVHGLSGTLLAGIFSVSIICTLSAFIFPLNIYFETTLLIVGLAAFFYFKIYEDFRRFFKGLPYLFYVLVFVVLFFGSGFPFILDHFGYYVPTIRWISEIGLVQGISNLDLLLGQMSVWHILQAAFSQFTDPFLRLNSLALIIYLIYIFEKKSWIHLVFVPVLFLFVQSPSPDLPAIALSLIILNELLRGHRSYGWLFALSAFVFALKPTLVWLPLFTFIYIVWIAKKNVKVLTPGIAVVLIFVFKNIWTFGFPVFPVAVLDLGLPWKPNMQLLLNSSAVAIERTFDMQFSANEIHNFSLTEYVYNWFFLPGIKGKINLLFIFSLLIFLVFSIKKNSKTIWLLFGAVLVKSVLVLMFSAQYRFFLDVFFVIFFIVGYEVFTKKLSLAIFAVMSVVVGTFISYPEFIRTVFPSFRLGSVVMGFRSAQLIEPAHYKLEKFKTYQVGNLKFNVVDGYPYSFDTPLPAILPAFIQEDLDAGIFPQLKGTTLKEGFVWRRITEQEKIQLQHIIDEFNSKQ
ncbi:cytoplasmic membrane protein [Flavobacteriaceae bacterium 3519-10]|nr:cytoplasmic membrane protein [Flavobacteriaceae bacterium 3519-10]